LKTQLITLSLILAIMAQPCAYAQSSDFDAAFAPRGAEARISLTIPLGWETKSAKSKPQLALVGRQYQSDRGAVDWALKTPGTEERVIESRLSMTLSSQPEFLMNDQLIVQPYQETEQVSDGVKTAGKVALGVGLVTLAAAVVFVGVFAIAYESDDE